ncbi:SIR2 family protein [Tatumella ptyseos]|uniref:SIR2 family protein n=1 Tax=Tatumella ptyseos TaxID=82987 RepID=UPI0023F4FA91|nr:SIR2 family protein [Tatumella ptyseos]
MYSLSMIDYEMRNYQQYKLDTIDDIQACVESLNCQPILFLGAGIIKRYADGPNWEELLKILAEQCPLITKPYAYYKQKCSSLPEVGTIFGEHYNDWAWGDGNSEFSAEMFTEDVSPDIYFKVKVARLFDELEIARSDQYYGEIEALKKIHPHAIITTNYDNLLSQIFPEYEVVIGERVIRETHSSIGELYKIHGCTTQPETLVINSNDYENFIRKKKYLSAKLLTYFIEHPLVFVGYSANDENIRGILSDLDEILSESGELIPNIYFINFSKNIDENEYPATEMLIPTDGQKNVRVKSIKSDDFTWIFEAFSPSSPLDKVSPKTLRAILARTYQLVRTDIPRNPIRIDYKTLNELGSNDDALPTLLGITGYGSSVGFNADYPYTPKTLGQELGFKGWYEVNCLLQKIKELTGVDIKSSDNAYHLGVIQDGRVAYRRYSSAALNLLRKVRDGEEFDLDM